MSAAPQQDSSDWYFAHFAALEARLNGAKASTVHQMRKKGFEAFTNLGFPAPKDEEWKYTNISPLVRDGFAIPNRDQAHEVDIAAISPYFIEELNTSRFVFVDGKFNASLSDIQAEKSFEFSSIEQVSKGASGVAPDAANEYFSHVADASVHSFTALNTALVEDGAVLVVPNNTQGDFIHVIHVSTNAAKGTMTFPRVMIQAEAGSEATVIESYVGLTAKSYFTNAVTEVVVEPNARLHHYKLVFEGDRCTHVGKIAVKQHSDSFFQTLCLTTGGMLVRNEVDPILDGTGIDSRLNGLTVLSGTQHVDNTTVIDHAKPHSESTELYKGIYGDKSRGVFSGTIIVRPDAQKTNAIQNNQSLLLSDRAESNSKPQLKIWADDVKCTHGATVGQLDKDALFYLRSRGIDFESSRNMLIHAFASDVLTSCNAKPIGEYLERRLMEKLEQLRLTDTE